jgi:peroxiredoxin
MVAMILVVVAAVAADSDAVPLKTGDPAPDWSGIIGVDGKKHSLSEYKKAKAVVLVFTCNHCPVAVAYEDRLIALQKDYKSKGVQVVAVNVNNIPADRLEPMKKRAKDKRFNFPYIYDETQKMGHDYAATVTPHVFLLDKDRKIAFIGPVDDSQNKSRVKKRHLRNALDAVLAGKRPSEPMVKPFGCTIKYEKK